MKVILDEQDKASIVDSFGSALNKKQGEALIKYLEDDLTFNPECSVLGEAEYWVDEILPTLDNISEDDE